MAGLAEQNANFVIVEQVAAITFSDADAQIQALKAAFAAMALFSLLALAYVRRLPGPAVESQEENRPQPPPQPG